jgi:hypothetical protein
MKLPGIYSATLRKARAKIDKRNTFYKGADPYGIHELLSDAQIEAAETVPSPRGELLPFAGDPCGNIFALEPGSGKVFFWDHETDEALAIAPSLGQFVDALQEPVQVDLKPDQVKAVWIDPEFLEEHRKKGNILE